MSYRFKRKPKYKPGTGPPPARSAATKELSKELGLPWMEKAFPYKSDDLPCSRCKKVRPTELVKSDSGLERLCEVCR